MIDVDSWGGDDGGAHLATGRQRRVGRGAIAGASASAAVSSAAAVAAAPAARVTRTMDCNQGGSGSKRQDVGKNDGWGAC